MIKHCSIKIYGQVQGVFFRQSAKQRADELGISGFVRNESDNTVYIEAGGEERNIQKFIVWCHEGPEYAQINKVEATELNPSDQFDNFSIR